MKLKVGKSGKFIPFKVKTLLFNILLTIKNCVFFTVRAIFYGKPSRYRSIYKLKIRNLEKSGIKNCGNSYISSNVSAQAAATVC